MAVKCPSRPGRLYSPVWRGSGARTHWTQPHRWDIRSERHYFLHQPTTKHILFASQDNCVIVRCFVIVVLWKSDVSLQMHFQCLLYFFSFPVFSIFQVGGRSGWKMKNFNDPEKCEEKARIPDDWSYTPHLLNPSSASRVLHKCKHYWEIMSNYWELYFRIILKYISFTNLSGVSDLIYFNV